jgi:hypothetical protein
MYKHLLIATDGSELSERSRATWDRPGEGAQCEGRLWTPITYEAMSPSEAEALLVIAGSGHAAHAFAGISPLPNRTITTRQPLQSPR